MVTRLGPQSHKLFRLLPLSSRAAHNLTLPALPPPSPKKDNYFRSGAPIHPGSRFNYRHSKTPFFSPISPHALLALSVWLLSKKASCSEPIPNPDPIKLMDVQRLIREGRIIVGIEEPHEADSSPIKISWYDVTDFPHPGPDLKLFNGLIISDLWNEKALTFHRKKETVSDVRSSCYIGSTSSTDCPRADRDAIRRALPKLMSNALSSPFSIAPPNQDGVTVSGIYSRFIRNHHFPRLDSYNAYGNLVDRLKKSFPSIVSDIPNDSINIKQLKQYIKTADLKNPLFQEIQSSLTNLTVDICGNKISLWEILNLELTTCTTIIACGGHRRADAEKVTGKKLDGSPWTNAADEAAFLGVKLNILLDFETLSDEDHIICTDNNEYTVKIPVKIAKEGMLCIGENGDLLNPVYGFPFRVVFPGLIGAYQIKELSTISQSTHSTKTPLAEEAGKSYYTRNADDFDVLPNAKNIKFSQCSDERFTCTGEAFSGFGVSKVEIKQNDGNWETIISKDPNSFDPYKNGMVPFEVTLNSETNQVRIRVTDSKGRTQKRWRFNKRGLYFNEALLFQRNGSHWNMLLNVKR